jgi:(p)ppGpp synthase/HD superfamily hydrolase
MYGNAFNAPSVLVQRAARIASEAHQGQKRKWDNAHQDYVVHCSRVAGLVAGQAMSEVEVAAAWLHDVLEDCAGWTSEHIRAELDSAVPADEKDKIDQVINLVRELTNPSHEPQHRHKPRAVRKQLDHAHLATISRPAQRIKLVDRLDNVNDLQGAPEEFVHKYLAETADLLEVIGAADPMLANGIRVVIFQKGAFGQLRTEVLHTITCYQCRGWWSMGPQPSLNRQAVYHCPYCGSEQRLLQYDEPESHAHA